MRGFADSCLQAAGFNVYYSNIWRNYGIFWGFCIFNFALVFFCSWLYLSGGKSIKDLFTRSKGKPKGAKAQSEKV